MLSHTRPRFITILIVLLLTASFMVVTAQEDTAAEMTPEVTEEPTPLVGQPDPEITEEPPAVTTETVTEQPPANGEQPAPEEADTPEQTVEPLPPPPAPQVPSAPPVFDIASGYSVEAGQSVSILFAVYDEQGAVVITQVVSAAGAQTALAIAAPVQDSPPFVTTGTITYTAAAESGTDTLTVTAVDGAGTSATAVVLIEVLASAEAAEEVTPEATDESVPTVERIISYDPAAPEAAIQAMLQALEAAEVSRIPQIGAMKVLVPNTLASEAQALAAVLGDQAAVAAGLMAFEENYIYDLAGFTPNDPGFVSDQWALKPGVGGMYVHNPSWDGAWDIAKQDGAGVLVAVLDTGVDLQHPDLAGQIDTAKGWDFINDDNDPDDDHTGGGHGTHVAGIIAARTNNGLYMAGIAYRSKIIPVKVCAASTGCPTYEIAAGIVHAVDRGAHIINMSLGGTTVSTTVQGAVQYALSRNVTVIAAAGNSGTAYQYPASYPGVISVASHDINGNISVVSTQNDRVTVSAPGVSVYSLGRLEQGATFFWTGTSTATANVSGVAALIYGDNVARTPARIREALICSAIDGGAVGYDNAFGNGMVQADWAMNWLYNSAGCKITQPNDLFQNATLVNKVPFTAIQPVHTRSVTADSSDPTDCYPPNQTLWYRFVPPADGYYQITSYGTSYNTVLAIYQGVPGNFVRYGCAGAGFDPGAYVSLDMKKGQSYYIVLMTYSGTPVNDQVARLDIRAAVPTANRDYQENAPNIAYTGNWAQVNTTGASGGRVMQTDSNNAYATFTFRGAYFELARVVGPTQGSMEIWVNNTLVTTLNNRAALQAVSPVFIFPTTSVNGQLQTVTIRRQAAGLPGSIAIDRIRPVDLTLTTVAAKADDRETAKFLYTPLGNWTAQPSIGAFKNTIMRTTALNTSVEARVRGSAVIIYRNTGPGFGSMNIFVDNLFWGTVSNVSANSALSVPFAITNLTQTEHVIRVQNNASSILEFDAIEGFNQAPLAVNLIFDLGVKNAVRSGEWSVNNTPSAFNKLKKTWVTSSTNARLDFNFTGDGFCFTFMRRTDGGTVVVYVDNMTTPYAQISTNVSPGFWPGYFWPADTLETGTNPKVPTLIQEYCTGAAFADGVHQVRLTFPSGFPVELDYLNGGRTGLILPSSGLVQENDFRIYHSDWVYRLNSMKERQKQLWKRVPMKSAGGAAAQGGYVKRVSFNPPPSDVAAVRFYFSGTGFIIYTTSGPQAGGITVNVCEPAQSCSGATIILNGVNQGSFINLNTANRARPFAYAVTGLPPGIYEVVIVASGAPGQYVDFDGVRVFP